MVLGFQMIIRCLGCWINIDAHSPKEESSGRRQVPHIYISLSADVNIRHFVPRLHCRLLSGIALLWTGFGGDQSPGKCSG
jgi:hypothetical protein